MSITYEVDNKFSINKHDSKINRMAIYSKFRLLNDLSKEIISKINNNPIPEIGSQNKKPYNSEFHTIEFCSVNIYLSRYSEKKLRPKAGKFRLGTYLFR